MAETNAEPTFFGVNQRDVRKTNSLLQKLNGDLAGSCKMLDPGSGLSMNLKIAINFPRVKPLRTRCPSILSIN